MSRVPAVERALAVLRYLAGQPGPVSAATLAAALGLPRSSVYQLLEAMAEQGFVTHLPEERRWGLGVSAFEVGSAYLRHGPMERLARPLLARLAAELGETVQLGILHGGETLYLLKEGPGAPTLVTGVGVRLPAYLTASGRAMLAQLPRQQVRALFPSATTFVTRTGRGPSAPGELRDVLAAERRQGWSAEDEEVTEGYASVAAAAFDHMGRPSAAIAVTFRSRAHPPESRPALAAPIRTAANELTRRLLGRPPS